MAEWDGVGERGVYDDEHQAERDRLSDAAHRGDWAAVLAAVERSAEKSADLVNTRRVAGRSGWAPLHQAAWHNAPAEVVERLLTAGAWRTLRSADDERPVDVATRLGHAALLPLLEPAPLHRVPEADLRAMQHFLHALIRVRTEDFGVTTALVLPQASVLTELPDAALWFRVPGMYGGFGIQLEEVRAGRRLVVRSHCRIVGHSGRTHHITPDGCTLTESGW
ncbi:ankyrin repeat domain-containing protein [Kitasatospora sp. NPDC057500]|uniref:ankyrin repeat domain-containing protein n=1 Tax=Kitasatospora sp. NPDC057500 TaxID=3346151 RepID=UPI0036C77065